MSSRRKDPPVYLKVMLAALAGTLQSVSSEELQEAEEYSRVDIPSEDYEVYAAINFEMILRRVQITNLQATPKWRRRNRT